MRRRAAVIPKDREQDAVAIMIHGTYASAVEDSGELWWQSDSPCSRRLQSFLPSFIRPTKEKEVFHWSGENSERARSKAAARLLRHLRSLEDQGQDYHLVGHSHGGSVIWNALQMSVLTKRPLRKLGSWTTVGTPFMHHRSRGSAEHHQPHGVGFWLGIAAAGDGGPEATDHDFVQHRHRQSGRSRFGTGSRSRLCKHPTYSRPRFSRVLRNRS